MHKYLTLLLLLPSLSFANAVPKQLYAPGGVVSIALGSVTKPAPEVYFQEQRVLVLAKGKQWVAVVGIPLSIQPGAHSIQLKSAESSQTFDFRIFAKDYPAQYITLKNKRMVNPNPDDTQRISNERPAINKALNTWTQQVVEEISFALPVIGRLSSPFGLKRFFNNQPKNPHSGLDIAAPTGTTISAPASGLVINTGSYYYNGNSVFIDHGQGLISGYFHLSKISVKAGQLVEQGTKLGEVGETGRVTGPHLHWNVYLNKTKVDPALFVPELAVEAK
ncbi:MAG: peptidoglycan DD-metalloendopeptidase family protein [Methyloprofundus sp.]|nr:peptidoglycan DD-metalloendopeptidase family protein [Methyloprofundus sp.]